MKVANLEKARGIDIAVNPELGVNWELVKDWNVDIRYRERSESDARALYDAITDNANGVLPWIRARW